MHDYLGLLKPSKRKINTALVILPCGLLAVSLLSYILFSLAHTLYTPNILLKISLYISAAPISGLGVLYSLSPFFVYMPVLLICAHVASCYAESSKGVLKAISYFSGIIWLIAILTQLSVDRYNDTVATSCVRSSDCMNFKGDEDCYKAYNNKYIPIKHDPFTFGNCGGVPVACKENKCRRFDVMGVPSLRAYWPENVDDCGLISEGPTKWGADRCYFQIAWRLNDTKACEKIQFGGENCYSLINSTQRTI